MNNTTNTASTENTSRVDLVFAKQRSASRQQQYPSLETRLQNLDKLHKILLENQTAIAEAINTDFGNRCPEGTTRPDQSSSVPVRRTTIHPIT